MLGASYGVQSEPQMYDAFMDRAVFEYKVSWRLRRCYNTGRRIWGTAVRGRAIWTGPGEPAVEDRWYHIHEGLIMLIKRSADATV
jgi:hypothetical protein